MCCVSEAMGMSLPGSALIPAPYGERLKSSFEAGRAVVNLVMNNITAKQVITKESIRNAIKVTMAICGSTNAVLHIAAIANEAKLDMNVVEEFRTLNLTTPQIAKVKDVYKRQQVDRIIALIAKFHRLGQCHDTNAALYDAVGTSCMRHCQSRSHHDIRPKVFDRLDHGIHIFPGHIAII